MKKKKQISITITDLSDSQKVFGSLDCLFKEILLYYCDKGDMESVDIFVLSIAQYIGSLMKVLGFSEEDFKDEY